MGYRNYTIYYFKNAGAEEDDLEYGYLVYYGKEKREDYTENVIAYLDGLKENGKIKEYVVCSDFEFTAYIN